MATDIEDLGQRWQRYEVCSCEPCAKACTNIPGIYDPEHLLWMLDHGHTMAELVPNLVEDVYYADGQAIQNVIFLRPRMVHETPGGLAPFNLRQGACINLGPNGCQLARQDMPIECISSYPCFDGPEGRALIGKKNAPTVWTTPAAQRVLELFEAETRRRTPGIRVGQQAIAEDEERFRQDPRAQLQFMLEMGACPVQ